MAWSRGAAIGLLLTLRSVGLTVCSPVSQSLNVTLTSVTTHHGVIDNRVDSQAARTAGETPQHGTDSLHGSTDTSSSHSTLHNSNNNNNNNNNSNAHGSTGTTSVTIVLHNNNNNNANHNTITTTTTTTTNSNNNSSDKGIMLTEITAPLETATKEAQAENVPWIDTLTNTLKKETATPITLKNETSSVHVVSEDIQYHRDDDAPPETTQGEARTTAGTSFKPYAFVNISAHECFHRGKTISLISLEGRIFLHNTPNTTTTTVSSTEDTDGCLISITVPPSRLIHVHVKHVGITFSLRDSLSRKSVQIDSMTSARAPGNVSVFFSSKMVVSSPFESLWSPFYVDVRFISIPSTSVYAPHLQLLRNSPSKGYIQTPLYDGYSLSCLSDWNFEHQVSQAVPPDHAVMLSMEYLDSCCGFLGPLKLILMNNSSERGQTLLPYKYMTSPTLYVTASFSVRFKPGRALFKTYRRGFRIRFSFHNASARPQRLRDGPWNCSVDFWPDFQEHLLCNFLIQCNEGVDEIPCFYTTEKCGRGRITIGDSCYVYVLPGEEEITWMDSDRMCRFRGERLAMMKPNAEWGRMTPLLWIHHNTRRPLFLGLQRASLDLPTMYRNVWQYTDGTIAYFFTPANKKANRAATQNICGAVRLFSSIVSSSLPCTFAILYARVLCEYELGSKQTRNLHIPKPRELDMSNSSLTLCPHNHVTRNFLSCDTQSACWGRLKSTSASCGSLNAQSFSLCGVNLTPQPPTFLCSKGGEHVSYTLVCDHRPDCYDNSDESFCVFPPCDWQIQFDCGRNQCLPLSEQCDQYPQCRHGEDEQKCDTKGISTMAVDVYPPAVVYLDTDGYLKARSARTSWHSNSVVCAETHVECPGHNYCIPIFLVCNGVHDCPYREDEAGCEDRHSCAGYYRCRGSAVCLHTSHICDGLSHCPQRDDELMCGMTCPPHCTCYGLAFFCPFPFDVSEHGQLRFLEARSSGLKPADVWNNTMLVHLGMAHCGLTSFQLPQLPNLYSLDLKDNLLRVFPVSALDSVRNLRSLSLAGNPVVSILTHSSGEFTLRSLHTVDLSNVSIQSLNVSDMSFAPNIKVLNVSSRSVQRITEDGFRTLRRLQTLDLRGCRISHFKAGLFEGLSELTLVFSGSYKFCCPAILPEGFNVFNCHAPSDEVWPRESNGGVFQVSSCQSLLRSPFFRVFLSIFSVLAVLGNLASLLVRLVHNTRRKRTGFDTFVTNLSLADCCMGVYLAVLGVADQVYQGDYVWRDTQWKNSLPCALAGFLSLLSSEVSALIICLITLDRFLVLRFPLSRVRFSPGSALVACVGVWMLGLVVAAVPLLPVTSHWRFYSQTGICLPLPVTRRDDFPGHAYSFGIMIVTNFVLFLLIAVGQVVIYISVQANTLHAYDSAKTSKDMTMARRLITIAVSDFLCWFPIGLLGLLAATGVAVPGEVNVVMVIFALPINSAINPFLYTLNILLERRRRVQEERIKKLIQSRWKDKDKF